ncbi:hypothetical protein DV737_g2854, partial [Chaetothyriales sp. CBS 132003]
MFAVPGWDLCAESLVTEKPSAKAGRSKADRHLLNKRKRSQWEAEDAHSVDDCDLEKRWNQRLGNDASSGLRKGPLALATEGKPDLGPGKSNSRGTPLTPDAKPGDQESTPSGSNGRMSHGPEDKLSRKQKKLWNRKRREQQAGESIASDPTAPVAPDNGISAKIKQTRKCDKNDQLQSSENRVMHDMQGQPTSNNFLPSGTPRAEPDKKGESVLHDPTPYPFSTRVDAWDSPAPDASPQQFAAKLTSARFRHLNQQLYTTRSTDSLQLFKSQPSLFTDYHLGFTQQTQSWPVNPVNTFITALQKRHDLPRRKTGSCTIADLGCGDAPLARALAKGKAGKKLGLRIHSFDLYAVNDHVTVADIASLPLRDGEADIAIFCLSLMGTNWLDFVEECWRILRGDGKGEVWVAEVKSRFVSHPGRRAPGQAVDNSVGKKRRSTQKSTKKNNYSNSTRGDEDGDYNGNDADDQAFLNDDAGDGGGVILNNATDTNIFSDFVSVFQRRGFKLKEGSVDNSNKMFVSMAFYKSGVPVVGKHKGLKWIGKEYQNQNNHHHNYDDEVDRKEEAAVLKPCVYKTR